MTEQRLEEISITEKEIPFFFVLFCYICGRDGGSGVCRRSVRGDVGEEVFKMFKGNRKAEREMYTGVQVSKTSYSDKCSQC